MGSYIFKFTEKFDFDRLKDVFEAVQGVITNGIYLLKETFIRVVTVHKERKISKCFQIVTQNVSCFYRLALQLRVGVHSFFLMKYSKCVRTSQLHQCNYVSKQFFSILQMLLFFRHHQPFQEAAASNNQVQFYCKNKLFINFNL